MTVGELIELLVQWPKDSEVVIRISDSEELTVEDGDYLDVTDGRSVLMEYSKVVIVGDVPPE